MFKIIADHRNFSAQELIFQGNQGKSNINSEVEGLSIFRIEHGLILVLLFGGGFHTGVTIFSFLRATVTLL